MSPRKAIRFGRGSPSDETGSPGDFAGGAVFCDYAAAFGAHADFESQLAEHLVEVQARL